MIDIDKLFKHVSNVEHAGKLIEEHEKEIREIRKKYKSSFGYVRTQKKRGFLKKISKYDYRLI